MPHRVDGPLSLQTSASWVEAVRAAIAAGNLPGVQEAYEEWLERDPRDSFGKDIFIFALADAIESAQPSILSYLLSQEIPYHKVHIKLAIAKNAEDALEAFLAHGWEINEPESWSSPPLLSVAIKDYELTRWFLSKGADPNAECNLDYTPLSVAIVNASFRTIKLLFEHGGSVEHGQLLHFAAARKKVDRLRILDFLLSKGAQGMNSLRHEHRPYNFAMLKPFGMGTPLHVAADEGLLDTVQYLLSHGADPTVKNSRGHLAIDNAEYRKHSEIVKVLSAEHCQTSS